MQTRATCHEARWTIPNKCVIVFLMALAIVGILPFFAISTAAAATTPPKPTPDTATWVQDPGATCDDGQSNVQSMSESLVYTDSNGTSYNMRCYSGNYFAGSTIIIDVIEGDAPHDDCSAKYHIIVGNSNDPKADSVYDATSATLVQYNNCNETSRHTIQLVNTFNNPTDTSVGAGVWTAVNPAGLHLTLKTAVGLRKAGFEEDFSQSAINDWQMIMLAGTPPAAGSCKADEIDVGTSANENDTYLAVVQATYITYTETGGPNPNQPVCSAQSGTIFLQDKNGNPQSYSEAGGSNTTTGTTQSGDPCPIDKNDQLRWIFCPILDTVQTLANGLIGFLSNMLYVQTDEIFGGNGFNGLQSAFTIFRNMGLGLMVIAGLLIVFSQATGLEIFSAYTVRKALPRLVMAIIALALVWDVLRIVIVFFNDIGTLMQGLILGAVGVSTNGTGGGDPGVIIGGIFEAAIGIGASLIFLTGGGLIAIVGSCALVLLAAFVVLAIRQLVIVLCIVLAPLAIACAVLPGTERLWKFWRDTLLTVLIMFPLIVGLLSSGAALSHIAAAAGHAAEQNGKTGQEWAWYLMAVMAVIAPLISINFAFQIAGGVMRQISAAIGNLTQGARQGLAQFQGRELQRNWQNLGTGGKFNIPGANGLNNRLNAASARLFNLRPGPFRRPRRFGGAPSGRSEAQYAHTLMASAAQFAGTQEARNLANNAPALRALSYGSESEARQRLGADFGMNQAEIDAGVSAVQANGGWSRARSIYAVRALAAANDGFLGTATIDPIQQAARTIARVSHGNEGVLRDLAGGFSGAASQAGRNDLNVGAGALIDRASDEAAVLGEAGRLTAAAASVAAGTRPPLAAPTVDQYNAAVRGSTNRIGVAAILNGHDAEQTRRYLALARRAIEDPAAPPDERRDAVKLLSELHSNLASATGGNAKQVTDAIDSLLAAHGLPGYALARSGIPGSEIDDRLEQLAGTLGIPITRGEFTSGARTGLPR